MLYSMLLGVGVDKGSVWMVENVSNLNEERYGGFDWEWIRNVIWNLIEIEGLVVS